MSANVLEILLLAWQIILIRSAAVRVKDPVADHSTRPGTQSLILPQDYQAFPDIHSAFKISKVPATWLEARDLCSAEGARLAIADTREKIAHINGMKTPDDKWLHVGIYKINDQWVSIENNLPVSSVPWATDYPDGTGNCTGITISGENGLVEYECESEGDFYVCELPESPSLPEGYRAFSDVHLAYKIYKVPSSWLEARDRCSAEDARLAIADTREKIAHINSLKIPSDKWLHVGIHKVNGQWVRIDNDLAVSSVPWAEDNPDGDGNCTGISTITQENGLVDYRCDMEGEHYVCEILL